MNISVVVFRFPGEILLLFLKEDRKLVFNQPSIHQNYNPMNISKFESDTSTGSKTISFN